MNCLINYIGIRFCEGALEVPESGIYVNSLPGISVEAMDNIASAEQITYIGLWNDVQVEAYARFQLDFYNELLKCHDVGKDCDLENLICVNKLKLALAWKYLLGNQFMIYKLYSPRLNLFTLDEEEATKLRDFYQAEYEIALSRAMKALDLSSCCLPCGGQSLKSVFWLP
jgi:hypothetical protein